MGLTSVNKSNPVNFDGGKSKMNFYGVSIFWEYAKKN